MSVSEQYPALRPLDFQPITYQNQQMWLLRDPLRLSAEQLIFPAPMAQLLMFIDGTRTVEQIQADFSQYVGSTVERELVVDAIAKLDATYLLNNQRAREAETNLLTTFRQQTVRPPALADLSYPSNSAELSAQFARYAQRPVQHPFDKQPADAWQTWRGRGIISPHIDYQRGGGVYARVWERAHAAVAEADLVIIFGTDHNGGDNTVTLTKLPFATPYGVLPTDSAVVDALAEAIGPEAAYAEELHHRDEHSIELSAVWLHHVYAQLAIDPKPMVPILIGSFHRLVSNGDRPEANARISAVIETIHAATTGKKVLAVASVDMAHVGPAFGDTTPMDRLRRDALRDADFALLEAASHGDAAGWYDQISAVADRNRVCGFSPVYYLLRFLGPTNGHPIAYDQCGADAEEQSLVSIGGMLLD